MNASDKNKFQVLYGEIYAAYGRAPRNGQFEMWWKLAQDQGNIDEFADAAKAHMLLSKYPPQLAELITQIKARRFPAPEEAWNSVPKSEADGAWMNDQASRALGACQSSLDAGDRVAARMAFLERYRVEVQNAKESPKWYLSPPTTKGAGCTLLSYEERSKWRAEKLEEHPDRRPALLTQSRRQLEAMNGSAKTGKGLQRLADLSQSILQGRKSSDR